MPEISVIMGVLCKTNRLKMLKRAVDSILNQSFGDFEFLICDDGSSEEVKRYLDKASENDSRIIMVRQGNMISLSEKLNICLKHSEGRYIARMDDDDYSHRKRFEIQLAFLKNDFSVDFVGCNVALSDNNKITGSRIFPKNPCVKDFFFTQPFIHPTLMFRREALLAVNGYSEDKRCLFCEDYDLLLRMYYAGMKGANIQTILFNYTLSETAKGKKKYQYRINEAYIRFVRFKELKCLPFAMPYVIKPLVVGLIPYRLLTQIKKLRRG